MKRTRISITLVFLLLAGVACAGENPVEEATVAPTPAEVAPARDSSNTGRFLDINEVGLGPNGFVALTNFTDTPGSLAGLYLCQGTECFGLPDRAVAPGETVRIAAGDGTGHENVVATQATFGELRPTDGEIALFASMELDDPAAVLTYFQWGSSPHHLTQVAIDAGHWVEGGYGPSSPNATRLFSVEETGLWLFEEPQGG